MRPLVYLTGLATIADGILHLLFPARWNTVWMAGTRRLAPGVAQGLERCYRECPVDIRRAQGFGWIALGALLLWWAGSAEGEQT